MTFPSWKELLIILLLALLIFGAKKLKSLSSDLGGSIRGFRTALKDGDKKNPSNETQENS
jgi:sec-independent protein translocase protein TatA